MNVVLLRVGVDTAAGGIHGPLFADGSFEFIPIPDPAGRDPRTYGTLVGRRGKSLAEYFPADRRKSVASQSVHVDPEFDTFTYGDPTRPKRGLRKLQPGDVLAFYAGLRGWDFNQAAALHIIGYFEVQLAGLARDFSETQLASCAANYHVRHGSVLQDQRDRLVLVKGGNRSRLLNRAVRISERGRDVAGRPLQVLSRDMRSVFGDLSGKGSIQRSNPRWIRPAFVQRAAEFIRSLE